MALFGKVYYTGLLVPFLLAVALGSLRNRLSAALHDLFQGINVSLFVCLASAMAFQLYLLGPQDALLSQVSVSKMRFDGRPANDIVLKKRQQGITAYPAPLPAATLESDRPSALGHINVRPGLSVLGLSGVANATTVYCSEVGPYLIYDSDEYGFSNPRQIWSQEMRLVFVGDSFTHGACVAPKDHFVSIVRDRFPGTFNLGMRGNGPLLELATLKEFVRDTNPEYIFWMYYEGNDLDELARESMDAIAISYLRPDFHLDYKKNFRKIDAGLAATFDGLLSRGEKAGAQANLLEAPDTGDQHEVSNPGGWGMGQVARLSDFLTFGELLSFARKTLCAAILDEYAGPCKSLPSARKSAMFRLVMASAKAFADQRGAKLVFVNLPSLSGSGLAHDKRTRMIQLVLKTLDIDNLDIRSLAAKWELGVEDGEIFAFGTAGGHYNRLGYGLVGCAILNYMSKHSDNIEPPTAAINCSDFVRQSSDM